MVNPNIVCILRDAYLTFGKDVFLDKEKTQAYFSDLLAEYPKEKRLLTLAVKENMLNKLIVEYEAGIDINTGVYADFLISFYDMVEQTAFDLIEILYEMISGKKLQYTIVTGDENTQEQVAVKPESEMVVSESKDTKPAIHNGQTPIFVDEEHIDKKNNLKRDIRLFQGIDKYDDELKTMNTVPRKITDTVMRQATNSTTKPLMRNLDAYDDELIAMEKEQRNKKKKLFDW